MRADIGANVDHCHSRPAIRCDGAYHIRLKLVKIQRKVDSFSQIQLKTSPVNFDLHDTASHGKTEYFEVNGSQAAERRRAVNIVGQGHQRRSHGATLE